MSEDRDQQTETSEQLAREILQKRKFTPEEALARMAGPGAMKDASPISPLQQAETMIATWLGSNLHDPNEALRQVLLRCLKTSDVLPANMDEPLAALATYCQRILGADYLLTELVREADVEWGRAMGEQPYFQREGAPAHRDDPYTVQTVRNALLEMLKRLPPS